MRRKTAVIAIAIVMCMLCACGAAEPEKTGTVTVYDLGEDMDHVEPCEYTLVSSPGNMSACVGELLQRIIDGPEGRRSKSAIPSEITSVTYNLGAQAVAVNLGSEFNDVPTERKILCEASIVRTLCQLDDVIGVSFTAGDQPVCDRNGVAVGMLTPDSFVENDGAMINAYERAELRLFFADGEGQHLVEKVENVTYNSNISMDRLVVDNIVRGPDSTDVYATVNPATVVNSVMTQDGICYVNLSDDLLNKTTNVSDEVLIYSIVNSLTEIGNINKVQILIDGAEDARLGEMDLSALFERNLELLK